MVGYSERAASQAHPMTTFKKVEMTGPSVPLSVIQEPLNSFTLPKKW